MPILLTILMVLATSPACERVLKELAAAEKAVKDCKAKYYGEGWKLWCTNELKARDKALSAKRACEENP
jgi:hypothetical protein